MEQIKNISDVSTVINCAALVKHFSSGNEIETVNVGGVKNLIEVCTAKNLRFIQVSTMSTIRSGIKDSEVITFAKNNLYTMQVLYRLGYSWPVTMWEYVEKFINMLQKLGFFSL